MWFYTSPSFHVDRPKTSANIAPKCDAKVTPSLDVAEDKTNLLVPKGNIFPFKGLVSRPSEPIGVPSLYFFLCMAQHIMTTMLSNLMAATKVYDMVLLVNEVF